MIRTTFAGSRQEPAEYEYTRPVECHVCGEEFDRDGHEDQLFDLEGVPHVWNAVICEDCDIRCEQCGWSVLTRKGDAKFVEDGVVWIDDEPYHPDCVAVALVQEAA